MVQNGIFWTIGEQLFIINYSIMYYLKIKVYRVETMNMGRPHCNNGVSVTIMLEQWFQGKMQSW